MSQRGRLSREEVQKVAMLARLRLSDREVDKFTGQLSQILDYVQRLGELDTSELEPLAHPLPVQNVFRPDEQRPSMGVEAALQLAPKRHGDFYLVPPVLE